MKKYLLLAEDEKLWAKFRKLLTDKEKNFRGEEKCRIKDRRLSS